jgi:hypothetical protein
MPTLSQRRIRQLLNTGTHVIAGKALQRGQLAVIKGRALEDLVVYLFSKVPGLILTARNSTNAFDSEELDVAFWNERKRNGLHFCLTLCWSNVKTGPLQSALLMLAILTERFVAEV